MKRVRDSAIVVGLMSTAMALAACPASLDDRCANEACFASSSGGDGGGDGRDTDAPDAVVPEDCDENADANASEAKGCIVDSFAVFVDGTAGDDANEGTKAKPFKKISTAITKGPAVGKRRVYVCGAGPYAEHVKLTSAVHVFGGFTCESWVADASVKTKVAPTDPGFALHLDAVATSVRLEDLAFESVAGSEGDRSSIA
ncbi:MAG: Glycine-rich cell wall structural protein precursor, partial [Labilithrix sp.]|nr:Glycine-rich cell wall structural protein precursor [Labilithrix sp.]